MERKDYANKFQEIKSDILNEIRELIPEDSAHHFSEKFYVHYIEGEVATTEICSAIEVWHGGMVVFIVHRDTTAKDEVIEGESVFMYDPESFLDILEHLKKDIREKKLSHLRDIVKKHGGKIDFDGSFSINIDERDESANVCGIAEGCCLMGLGLTSDGTLAVHNTFCEDEFINEESSLLSEDLDKLIAYVKHKVQKTFNVTISERRSRKVEIVAETWEDAVEKAKKLLETKPLNSDDSDGFEYY